MLVAINTITWLLIIGIPLYGIYAGSSHLFFTGIIAMLAGLLIHVLSPVLTSLLNGNAAMSGTLQAIIYLILCSFAFPLGWKLNRIFQFTVDPFDFLLGFIFGAGTAVVIAHFALTFLLTAYSDSTALYALQQSAVVRHFVKFDFWHNIVNFMTGLSNTREAPKIPD